MKYNAKRFIQWTAGLYLLGNSFVLADVKGNNNLTPNDFAYGITIETKNKQAIQATVLPLHFYEHLRNKTFTDYRVFDARGQVMPSRIKNSSFGTSSTETKALNFYPIHAPKNKNLDALSLSLDRKKSKLSVVIDDSKKTTEKKFLIAYIVENNPERLLEKLSFEWLKPETGFIKNIHIEHSPDLTNWSNLKRNAGLSRLQYQDRMIGHNNITINAKTKQYLRIRWSSKDTDFVISDISASYTKTAQKRLLEKRNQKVTLKNTKNLTKLPSGIKHQNAYTFNLPGALPVSSIELNSNLDNYSFQARLFSRKNSASFGENQFHWNNHGNLEQYQLVMDDQILESSPKNLGDIKNNEWLISFTEPKNLSSVPEVNITWQQEYLVFLAQGESPYTLAYGNPSVRIDRSNTSRIIDELSDEEWQKVTKRINSLTEPRELGGIKKLQIPQAKKSWRITTLWGVLILGVIAMGWMVFRLISDSKKV